MCFECVLSAFCVLVMCGFVSRPTGGAIPGCPHGDAFQRRSVSGLDRFSANPVSAVHSSYGIAGLSHFDGCNVCRISQVVNDERCVGGLGAEGRDSHLSFMMIRGAIKRRVYGLGCTGSSIAGRIHSETTGRTLAGKPPVPHTTAPSPVPSPPRGEGVTSPLTPTRAVSS